MTCWTKTHRKLVRPQRSLSIHNGRERIIIRNQLLDLQNGSSNLSTLIQNLHFISLANTLGYLQRTFLFVRNFITKQLLKIFTF
ncbi:hypothetical protein FGO68_gene13212 [Halteria grandinella]|uniref:Uncharacterized protein n=1 Tax=Halteria grandinella TaxID=5974 RepID=A0A8J8NGR8_HALGN|nr:hypothetical protein FGO68_gene13212 [Halteria grandinella]